MSSRLLNLKSANALLELPPTGNIIAAGNSVSAIVISDISCIAGCANSLSSDSTVSPKINKPKEISTSQAQDIGSKVAILTVSDTVASGAGPDRRYAFNNHFPSLLCMFFVLAIYIGLFASRIRGFLSSFLVAPWMVEMVMSSKTVEIVLFLKVL